MPTLTGTNKAPGQGLLKGLAVTLKNMVTPASTQQYPHEKPDLAPRTRGVIALMDENCTVCMLCAKECPDWCIYIESHKERVPASEEGGRERTRNQLDRFAIDFALCMYCGICVEVCPFDALFWSPEFEYSTYTIAELTHEAGKLREWMDTVPPPPPLEEGAEPPQELDRALQEAEDARQAALEQARKEAAERAGGVEGGPGVATGGETEAETGGDGAETGEIEVEAKVDEEIYERLTDEGKSDRVARAMAKAAYVRREKARIREERAQQAQQAEREAAESSEQEAAQEPAPEATAAPSEPAQTDASSPAGTADATEELDIEPGAIDQATYDTLIEEGKSERIARARAKAAAIRKAKARARDEQEGGE